MPVNNSRYVAENKYREYAATVSAYNNASKDQNIFLPPVFQRWAVVEVFFDPFILNDAKKLDLIKRYSSTPITNSEFLYNSEVPRNAILARRVINKSEGDARGSDTLTILYPLFPSYLALPCKPGEHIWVMFERLTSFDSLGYWVCGIVGPGFVEDVNHSHFPRRNDINYTEENAHEQHDELRKNVDRYSFKDGGYFPQDPSFYERILDDRNNSENVSEAVLASVYESVPRFKKRPGDIALEGSNNALIVIGRDRTGEAVTYITQGTEELEEQLLEEFEDEDDKFTVPVIDPEFKKVSPNDPLRKKRAGSIDIVAGRGQRFGALSKGGNPVFNDLARPEIGKLRAEKGIGTLSENEGDPDFTDDRSRVYVSQNTLVDRNLLLDLYNDSRLMGNIKDNPSGDAGIIIKSDKIRIFARSDVQIMVSGYDVQNIPTGIVSGSLEDQNNTIKNQKFEDSNFASITIKTNGDIVFRPSLTGFIKLGDDTADRAILCTDFPAALSSTGVDPTTPPITNDMGGKLGGTGIPTQGTWASKVLVIGAR